MPDAPSLADLLEPGVLGFFRSFELVEIFAAPPDATPVNLLTIAVAEETVEGIGQEPQFLSPRLKIASLKRWNFGVQRYRLPVSALQPALDEMLAHQEWRPSGCPSRTGRLSALGPVFAPPDSTVSVPLNRVLKNNFWNGSHIFEWGDPTKELVKPLTEDPRRLQELSEKILAAVPIRLASLSDRLGHVIVQVPVKILMAAFGFDKESGGISAEIAWASEATPRRIEAPCEMTFDKLVTGCAVIPTTGGRSMSPPSGRGELRAMIWDADKHIALAACAPTSFIRSMKLNLQIGDPEPRTFSIARADGTRDDHRIGLKGQQSTGVVGEAHGDDVGGWTERRIYEEEAARLVAQRRFKAYRSSGDPAADHEKALNDIRLLIAQHGAHGAWLWDPYLGAAEIIATLFHCPFANAELRGLTAGKNPELNNTEFIAAQKAVFESLQGNLRGLKLEFRARAGHSGWPFHDRFLIFPNPERRALAWSLGTSVNSFGKEHHILQQADNGQLIADSFRELWDELANPENLVWKRP